MTPAERCITVAVMALVLALLCIRLAGQFVAGHAARLFSRQFRRKHHRHGKHQTPPRPHA